MCEHDPWHSCSCGQTRPQISGRLLDWRYSLAASRNSPCSISHMAEGMSLWVGQASTQGAGSGQCTHREASNIASSGVIGMQISSKSHTLDATERWLMSRLGSLARSFRSIAKDSPGIFSIQHLLVSILFSYYRFKRLIFSPYCHIIL